jgi:hypothetical protein
MTHARPVVLLACALLVTSPGLGSADEPTPDPAASVTRARQLFESGTAHYNLSEYREAIEDFKQAYRLKSDPVFLFNIGQCHRQLGEFTQAAQSYRSYLRSAPEAKNRGIVERFIRDMEVAAKRTERPPTTIAPLTATPPEAPSSPAKTTTRIAAAAVEPPKAEPPVQDEGTRSEPPSRPAVSVPVGIATAPSPASSTKERPDLVPSTVAAHEQRSTKRRRSRTGLWAGIGAGGAALVGGGLGLGLGLGLNPDQVQGGVPSTYFGSAPVRFP